MANIQRIVNGAPAPTAVGVPSSPDPLTSLAQIGTSIASGMEERESVTFYNKARVEGRKALFDIQEEERDNPDYATYADRVTTRFEKTVGSLASGAPNPRAADQIKTQFADWGETAREQATIYSEKQRHAENLDLVREDGDGYAKQVLAGADYTEARTGMVEMILAHAATGNISPDEARAESDALISGLARARFLGAVEDNPYEAKKMLSAGSEIYDDLSADEIVKYENVANAEINRRKEAAKAEQARVISDLEVAIYDETGTYDTNQLDDFEGAVNKLYDSGVMSAPKRTSLMKKINSIRADDGAVGAYTNMIASGVPLSPGDKNARKAVDHFFTTYVAPTLDQEDPAGNNAKMASFVAEVGMIPQSVENTIRGSLRAGDPQTRTLAADLVARISEANPDALTELPKREVDDAIYLTEMIGMGVPADKAIERLDDGKRLTEAERSAARQIAKDDKHSELHAQYTAEKIVRTGFFNDDPKLPAVAQAEFNRIADSEFERTGSIDTAHAVALIDFSRVGEVTSIDGSDRWMKSAPA